MINTNDQLYFFNDGVFHTECLQRHPVSGIAKKYPNLFLECNKPSNRKSLVSGKPINNYENEVFIPFLSSNEKDFLHQFNFKHIDMEELKTWNLSEKVANELRMLSESDQWVEFGHGNYLKKLSDILSENSA